MKTQYKVVGLDRDGGDCECCGRINLRKLVLIQVVRDNEDAEVLRIGTGCAAKLSRKSFLSAGRIESAAANATDYPGIAMPLKFS